jgi:hypothetical protein
MILTSTIVISSVEPLHIAEVLTVRQICILWIHTVCHLDVSRSLNRMRSFELKHVTITLYYMERFYLSYMHLTFDIST